MKIWRVKHYSLAVSRRRVLRVSFRRFRTRAESRSRKNRQLVFDCLGFAGLYEIAFRLQTYKRPRRRSVVAASVPVLQVSAPYSLLVIGLVGVALYGHSLISNHKLEPVKTFSAASLVADKQPTAPVVKPLPASVPTHLNIPAVNIDADIMTVGQAPDGSIQMPPILDWITGWYKYSPTPGQIGPAVIVGHVDNYQNISVFWRLRYLQPGNDIYVTRTDGSIVHFQVTALQQVSQADFPSQQVYGNINYPGLRLITCGGSFSTATGSYDQNTVVYARMVN